MTSPYALHWPVDWVALLLMGLSVQSTLGGCHIVDLAADAAAGCAVYAADTCQTYARCGATFLAAFGSLENCNSTVANTCTNTLLLPDVIGTGAGAAACGEQMLSVDCNDLVNGDLPPGCQPAGGLRADGVPCRVGAQCASTRCALPSLDATSGECREPAEVGEACLSQADCPSHTICSVTQFCAELAQAGEACGGYTLCRSPFACDGVRCVLPPMAAGCDPTTEPCDDATACRALGAASCARLASCSLPLVEAVYGDQATCAARSANACMVGLSAPGVVSSPAGIDACMSALANTSCQDIFSNALPAACRLGMGPRPDGAACGADAQCGSSRCMRAANSPCGVCATLAIGEQACIANSDCSAGLVCSPANVCRLPGDAGASCDPEHPCGYPLVCAGARCVTALDAGAACQYAAADSCNRYAGLACGASGQCERWAKALPGQPCGTQASGWAVCSGGSICDPAANGGTCAGPLPDGTPCTVGSVASCFAPARCIGGACRFDDPQACP